MPNENQPQEDQLQSLAGEPACKAACQIGCKCLSGYLNHHPQCDEEINRVMRVLLDIFPGEQITVHSQSGYAFWLAVGTHFQCVLQIAPGPQWEVRDGKPVRY